MKPHTMDPEELRKTIERQNSPSENDEVRMVKNPQELYSWKAPLRAYKRKSAGVLRFYIALALLITLVSLLMGEKMLILPIWATIFLVYVLTITPPPVIENKITKFGIETAGQTYRWDTLSHFYFVQRFDYEVLVIIGKEPYNSHIYLVIPHQHVHNQTLHYLSEHLVFQDHPKKTLTDRLAEWLTTLMPDEEPQVVSSRPEATSL